MSRRGDAYEERDYYSREEVRAPPTRVRERDYEETDTYSRRSERGGSRPEFLRDDFGRGEAGPLVIRERDTEIVTRPHERRARSPSPVRIRERIIERSPTPPQQERIRTRVVERERREPSPPPQERLRARVIETRERIRERSPSPVRIRERIVERERERERSPSPIRIRERIIERERERERSPSPQVDRVRIRNFEREIRQPSPEPTPSPSPPPPPAIRAPPIHQEIITHHRHINHGFEHARVPTPPPPPRRSEARTQETDIDIYTSRNNTEVDITRKESRARSPKPKLKRQDTYYDDTVIYEQERDKLRVRDTRLDINRRRSMSARPERREKETVRVDIRESGGRDFGRIGRDEEEADYYERKVQERAVIGEAYNGATKDWAIVDVPPGTERVQMDGVGGGSQEITWQKYNGVRRSKFNPERERERERIEEKVEIRENTRPRETSTSLEIDIHRGPRQERGPVYEREYERIEETSDRRVGFPRAPPKQRMGDLWTEITKDLVAREAIDELGYDYEETEFFFYVLQYLRYEDVLELVQLSETIRRERKHRLREIEYERERMERWERKERRRERERDDYTDERIIEREVIYDGRPPRRGGW